MHPIILLTTLIFSLLVGAGSDAAPSRPSVLLVPGAFHSPSTFHKVIHILRQSGYEHVYSLELCSVGRVVGRQDDVNVVISALNKELDQGRDVVLVGNSYGSTVIGEAVEGFPAYPLGSLQDQPNYGPSRGRVLGLIFQAGYIPTIDDIQHPELRKDIRSISSTFFRFDDEGKVWWDGDMAKQPPQETFYNLLPAKEASYWSKQLKFSSFSALNATAKYIPYTGDFRVVYVIGSQDHSIPPAYGQAYVDQPGAKIVTAYIDADHEAIISKPNDIVALIRRYAENKGQWTGCGGKNQEACS